MANKKKKRQRLFSRAERLEATALREAVAFSRGERTHRAQSAAPATRSQDTKP